MNFKTVLASALIAAGSLVAAPASANMICDNLDGLRFCGTPGSTHDELMVTHPVWGTETIKVTCAYDSYSFNSSGDWTQHQVESAIQDYCGGRGWNAHN